LDERPDSAAFIAASDATLIGNCAAKRGRSAAEGGAEHACAKRAIIIRSRQLARRIERREPRPVGGHATD